MKHRVPVNTQRPFCQHFRQPHLKEMDKAIEEASKAGLGIVAMKTGAGVYWDSERQHPINMKAAL